MFQKGTYPSRHYNPVINTRGLDEAKPDIHAQTHSQKRDARQGCCDARDGGPHGWGIGIGGVVGPAHLDGSFGDRESLPDPPRESWYLLLRRKDVGGRERAGPVVETKRSWSLLLWVPSHDVKRHEEGEGCPFRGRGPQDFEIFGHRVRRWHTFTAKSRYGQGGAAGCKWWLLTGT